MKKFIYNILGIIFFGLGALGAFLPVLPTVPFLLLASYFFTRGSKRFENWFKSTSLYKEHLENFVEKKAMTRKEKMTILIPVTVILILAFVFTPLIYGRIVILLSLVIKDIYFYTQIKTLAV